MSNNIVNIYLLTNQNLKSYSAIFIYNSVVQTWPNYGPSMNFCSPRIKFWYTTLYPSFYYLEQLCRTSTPKIDIILPLLKEKIIHLNLARE